MTPPPTPAATAPGPTLAEIARRFWWPAYGALRDGGVDPEAAALLTGRMLARLANGSPFLRHEDHDGRLRFLIHAELNAVLEQSRKVSGAAEPPVELPVDLAAAEARDDYGPAASETGRFRDRWATVVLELALESLRTRAVASGNRARLDRLVPFLGREIPDWWRTDINQSVDGSDARNLRDEFRQEVRRVVGETVTTPMILESELADLFV